MRALHLTKINGISISQWMAGGVGIFVKWPHGGRTRLIVLPLGILSLSLVFIAETWRGRFSQHKTGPSRANQSYPEPHKQRIFISTVPLYIRFYSGKGRCNVEINPYLPLLDTRNDEYVSGIYISVEKVTFAYMFHAI
jgi:hypothetical protein